MLDIKQSKALQASFSDHNFLQDPAPQVHALAGTTLAIMTFSGQPLHGNVINTTGESAILEKPWKIARYLAQLASAIGLLPIRVRHHA